MVLAAEADDGHLRARYKILGVDLIRRGAFFSGLLWLGRASPLGAAITFVASALIVEVGARAHFCVRSFGKGLHISEDVRVLLAYIGSFADILFQVE